MSGFASSGKRPISKQEDTLIQTLIRWWRGTDPALAQHAWDDELLQVVHQAWAGGFTVSSDLARSKTAHVAMAATLGLITTREPDGSFGRTWYVTQAGIGFLEDYWEDD